MRWGWGIVGFMGVEEGDRAGGIMGLSGWWQQQMGLEDNVGLSRGWWPAGRRLQCEVWAGTSFQAVSTGFQDKH